MNMLRQRTLRQVQMAINMPNNDPVFTDSEEEIDRIDDTSDSDSCASLASFDENLTFQESPILHQEKPITYVSDIPMEPNSDDATITKGSLKINILSDIQLKPPSTKQAESSSNIEKMSEGPKHTASRKERIRRKHTCLFCNLHCSNFARHLERNHDEESSVQEFLCLKKNSKKRKKLIDKLRREGDFCTSVAVPVMRQDKELSEFIVCKFCKGYYSAKCLRRHAKQCYFNPDPTKRFNARIEGQTVMAGHFGPNDILRSSGILNMLRADKISMVLKKDYVICEVGRRYIRRHKEKHLLSVAKRNMRRLARLLIAARSIVRNDKLRLIDFLTPQNFKVICKATEEIGGYNEENHDFESPSLALQMGTIIKSAINAAYSIEIQKADSSSELLQHLKDLERLIDTEWAHEISSKAGQNLAIKKFNKPTLIPVAEDIAKFEKYLNTIVKETRIKLVSNPQDLKSYRILLEAIFCSVLIFNKRRVGELQRLTLTDFTKFLNKSAASDFEKMLSESEKILCKSLKRVVIRGKRGRGVPVLFNSEMVQAIEFLISLRTNFDFADSPYLFGLPGSHNTISGTAVMKKHAKTALGDSKKASLLTSTKLRKHLATIVQILKMEKNELEQLATFMGHTETTHAQFYRLPDDIYQTAKVSKLLMLAKSVDIEQHKGKSLSEIQLDDELVETESGAEESDREEEENLLKYREKDDKCTPLEIANDISDLSIHPKKEGNIYRNKKSKRKLIPWTKKQKSIAESYFSNHIASKKAPKKIEVLSLIEKYPDIFTNKSWATIKVYVQNKYTKGKNSY